MKTTVLLAQAIRRTTARAPVYFPGIVDNMKKRFGFVEHPRTPQEMLPPEGGGLTFKHGRLTHENREIVIDTLHIHAQAIIVETGISTDDADTVLDVLLSEAAGIVAEDTDHPRMYVSRLEVRSDMPFRLVSDSSAALTMNITESIRSYFPAQFADRWPAPSELFAVAWRPDPTLFLLPCEFRIERREGHPFKDGVYFSQAPLRTAHHIATLEKFEQAMKTEASTSSSEPQPPGGQSPNAS